MLDAPLIVGNAGDAALVRQVLRDHDVDTVMHFAASISVPDSVREPLAYYRNNTVNTRALLEACAAHGLEQFVFSSTAAVYGMPANGRASEVDPTQPINPYGRSKLMSEWMLRDLEAATATGTHPLRYVALRYFNVAGADSQLRIGQALKASFHLVHVAAEHVSGRRPHIAMFGTDYDTPDGTAIRDYLHVEDLASAHLNALDHLRAGKASTTLNVGYGHGFSVRAVLDAVQRASDRPLVIQTGPRRAGDPPVLVAEAARIRAELGWQPQKDDIDQIVRSAIGWEKKLRAHPWG